MTPLYERSSLYSLQLLSEQYVKLNNIFNSY
jgi:hypothetical protein